MDIDIAAELKRLQSSCRWWRGLSVLALLLAIAALVMPRPRSQSFDRLSADTLRVKWLDVVDDKGNVIVSMHDGAGGGLVSISSSMPNDHNVMIMASEHGASVQVSSQAEPRQFGVLKIMDRKPFLQMYQVGDDSQYENFYQAPIYSSDGKYDESRR